MMPFEGPEHLADSSYLVGRVIDQSSVTDAHIPGELQLGLRFGGASCRDSEELSKGASPSSSTGALGNVRRNRYGCPPQLRREAESLIVGETQGQLVDVEDEPAASLPNLQPSVIMHAPHLPDSSDSWNRRDLRYDGFRTQYPVRSTQYGSARCITISLHY